MQEFIKEGANTNNGRRQKAFDVAKLMESEVKLLEVFIEEKGVDAILGQYGYTALMYAARQEKQR